MYKTGLHIVVYLTYFMFVMLISACTNNVISIDSKDRTRFTTLETSIPVSRGGGARLKLRTSRSSGDYSQAIPDGKLIIIDDIQIWGPTDMSGTTDLTYGSISLGGDNIFDGGDELQRKLRTSVYFGLAQTVIDLMLVHEGTTYKVTDRTTEFYIQWGMSYGITPSFYAGGTYAMSIGPDLTGIFEGDLKIDYTLFNHLQIMGGYRWLDYNYYVDQDDSVIGVKFRGPFVGLYVPF